MTAYLDHAATTPMRPEAVAAYVEALGVVGNPSSIHTSGQNARRVLEEAREGLAETLGCSPIDVVLTSGGTEAINLAIKGLFWVRPGDRIVVPGGEHHATIDTVEWLERHERAILEWLPLDEVGRVRLDAVDTAFDRSETGTAPGDIALATMLWANNEVGTLQPVVEVASRAAAAGVPLHVDAVAAFGHVPLDVSAVRRESGSRAGAGLVALSVSAHKLGGPVGVGALVLDRSAVVEPLVHGGGQQRQVRSGTQDVAAAVAFTAAARASVAELSDESARLRNLRHRLVTGVLSHAPGAVINGDEDADGRLPGTAHFAFPGAQGDSLLFLLDAAGVSVSTGSACQAGIPEPSHVLIAMGRDEYASRGALRVTLGRTSTDDDIDRFLSALPSAHAQAVRAGLS